MKANDNYYHAFDNDCYLINFLIINAFHFWQDD